MARPMGPRFKQSRRFGVNIFGHPKELKRGQKTNQKLSEYGKQLLEKQKLKAYYGLSEKQMRKYMVQAIKESRKSDRITGDILVSLIERRLDNMVYRLGFAKSLRQARQMVVHGHIRVNGNKVDILSYIVSVGDEISLRERSRSVDLFKDNIAKIDFRFIAVLDLYAGFGTFQNKESDVDGRKQRGARRESLRHLR